MMSSGGSAFGPSSATTRFLRQALHSRRLLLLVDDLHLIPVKMQTQLLHLEMLIKTVIGSCSVGFRNFFYHRLGTLSNTVGSFRCFSFQVFFFFVFPLQMKSSVTVFASGCFRGWLDSVAWASVSWSLEVPYPGLRGFLTTRSCFGVPYVGQKNFQLKMNQTVIK